MQTRAQQRHPGADGRGRGPQQPRRRHAAVPRRQYPRRRALQGRRAAARWAVATPLETKPNCSLIVKLIFDLEMRVYVIRDGYRNQN